MVSFMNVLLAVASLIVLAAANGDILSPEDPNVVKEANFAISTYNLMNSNNAYAFKLISVQSATAQIIPPARVKYSLLVTVGQTSCKNSPDIDLADCGLHGKTMTCDFVVLAVPNSDVPSYLLKDQCQ